MKPPKNGCLVLERIRAYGHLTPTTNAEVHKLFEMGLMGIRTHIPAFFDPVSPITVGQMLPQFNWLIAPYPDCWIETVDEYGTPIGYRVISSPSIVKPDKIVLTILAWSILDAHPQHKPKAIAAIRFATDAAGEVFDMELPPIFNSNHQHPDNMTWQANFIAPCIVMLQRMAITNIGFFEERDPDENNPKLTRAHRRALIARRYYILTIRNEREMRAGQKVVERKGVLPYHWARKHKKHFGPASVHKHPDGRDRGLAFGWLAGVFTIAARAKGDRKNGEIVKDYKIADPNRLRRRRKQPLQTADVPPIDVAFQSSQAAETAAFAAATSPLNQDQPARQEARQ